MTGEAYEVTVGAGSLRGAGWSVPHRWTDEGVTVDAPFVLQRVLAAVRPATGG